MNAPVHFRDGLLAAGLANQRRGHLPEAEKCYRLILAKNARDPEALYRMGILALQCANASGAVHFLVEAAKVVTLDADGRYNLGMAYVLEHAFDQAQVQFEAALALDASHPSAAIGLGNVHKFMGRPRESAEAYLRALSSPRLDAVLFSQLLVGLHASPVVDPFPLFELHCEWAHRFAASGDPETAHFANLVDPNRRLRIGLVSPNLTANIVGHFLRAVLPSLSRDAELYVYDAGTQRDWLTDELERSSTAWRNIAAGEDLEVAAQIKHDGIDVLVDLAGHVPGNRLQLFARRPAPVQATWLDYFDTTGVATIDVIVTDAVTTPEAMIASGAQRFVERVERLPHARLCYAPPPYLPEIAAANVTQVELSREHVAFGCFGRADKVVPDVVALWSRVMTAVPSSMMILKSTGFEVASVRERILADFEAHGVAHRRIEFRQASDHATMLREYADVDVALDTFPYNGGATTCDALLMGVPVVTLAGTSMIARQGASLLHAAGCVQWVAQDDDAFIRIAQALAVQGTRPTPRCALLRAELRAQVIGSRLCDGEAFARDLMDVFRSAWSRWCGRASLQGAGHARPLHALGDRT